MSLNGTASVVVLAGGGIDSTACLYQLRSEGFRTRAVHIDFGQRASALEWQAVQRIAKRIDVHADQIAVRSRNVFTRDEIPGRNAALVLLGVMHLLPEEKIICLGVHAGTPFVDCSKSFVASLASIVAEQTDSRVRLVAPLHDLTKPETVALARSLGVPMELTHSCQTDTPGGCGSCHSCKDRRALGC